MTTVQQPQHAMAYLSAVMDAIVHIIEQETSLVRAGRLAEASKLTVAKTDLANRYYAGVARIKEMQLSSAAPEALAALQRKHVDFSALLQMNLTVLATAHAVSEGIMRGVSDEMTRKSAPSTYGATGRANPPSAGTAQPLAVSRVL